MQTTANLGLKKPEGTDVVNIQDFNDNADLLDNYAAATATLIGTKAPLASPALTGTPTAPTATVDTSTTQVASTAFVLGQAGMTAPVMNGTTGIGSSKRYARADHVHPVDTSRAGQVDFAAHLADYTLQVPYKVTTGVANTYAVALAPALTSYLAGVAVCVKINIANTGASTINVNGLGAKSILDSKGSGMTSGKLRLNGVYTLRYDGTSFILQGEGGEYGTATAPDVLAGKTIGTDAGLVSGTMPIIGVVSAVAQDVSGTTIRMRPPSGYSTGTASTLITATDPDFIPANILSGKNIFGVTGTLAQGKKSATGSMVASTLDVTGLDFMPSVVVFWIINAAPNYHSGLGVYNSNDPSNTYVKYAKTSYDSEYGSTTVSREYKTAATITSNGFTIPTGMGVKAATYWLAYE